MDKASFFSRIRGAFRSPPPPDRPTDEVEDFLRRLNEALQPMERLERARTVQYYREILEDRMEEGCGAAEAVAELEPVEVIAARLLESGEAAAPRRRRGWSRVLLILGSPLWLVWLVVLCSLTLVLYAVSWAVIAALFAVVLALVLALLAGVVGLLLYVAVQPLSALFLLGAGMVCAALGIALFFPTLTLTRWVIRGTTRAAGALWRSLFPRKEDAA